MGVKASKIPTKEDMVYEMLRQNTLKEAAELMFRYFIEDKINKLTILTNLSKGETSFSVVVLENTAKTNALFMKISEKHNGVFDDHIMSQVKLALSVHEIALKVQIDTLTFKLLGTVLDKM